MNMLKLLPTLTDEDKRAIDWWVNNNGEISTLAKRKYSLSQIALQDYDKLERLAAKHIGRYINSVTKPAYYRIFGGGKP